MERGETMKKRGALVIAHGSSKSEWVAMVDDAVERVDVEVPVAVGFLEMVEGRGIPDAIRSLEEQGVEEIVAVPLFVSSGSGHIAEIARMLGVEPPHPVEADVPPIEFNARVRFCRPMDDHPFIARILTERAKELSTVPQDEWVLLVGHGNETPVLRKEWEQAMDRLAGQIQRAGGFAGASSATFHPDNLRERAEDLARDYRLLVVPLFLSEGYFTRKVIPSRLEGIPYVYSGHTYLPHPLVSEWITTTVREALEEQPVA
jgi:sirohydrochlorin cobaltochelatase